jgi:hypothetical protein
MVSLLIAPRKPPHKPKNIALRKDVSDTEYPHIFNQDHTPALTALSQSGFRANLPKFNTQNYTILAIWQSHPYMIAQFLVNGLFLQEFKHVLKLVT